MNLRTFYRLFYRHRIKKASIILKLYIILLLPIKYLINIFYLEKKINLEVYKNNFSELFDKDLNTLFEHFNTDKGEYFVDQYLQPSKINKNKIKAHGYTKTYEIIFSDFKDKNFNILELGSFYGNAAAALYFYFKQATIFSADINPDMFKYKSDRINNFYIDSSSRRSLIDNVIDKKINFDIIIEDASHALKSQIISLFMLFPLVNSGGYFVIEELDFPEIREDMNINQSKPNLKQILENVITGKDFNSVYINNDEKKYFLENYSTIEIKKGNFNEIAVIKKK